MGNLLPDALALPIALPREAGGEDRGSTALLTPRGRGAVATVRFTGAAELLDGRDGTPLFRAANGRAVSEQALGRIVFGRWGAAPAEEVVLCRVGADELEIHCHGGDAAARRIIAELEQADCPQHAWQTAGPFFETECTVALTRAVTLRTAALLLEQQSGVLHDCFARLAGTVWSPEGRGVAQSELEALLSWADFGLHLTQPWNVVLAGRPNVGKSSLINALVGYARSVVFDLPGTTRDVVTAEAAFAGWPVQLADTAGIRDNAPDLEAAGIERTQARLAAADCRVLVLDVSEPPHADDRRLLAAWPDAICLAHKADLPNVWGGELPAQARAASARTGQGIAELAEEIVAALVPRVPAAGTPLPVTRRQVELLERAHESLVRTDEPAFRAALRCLTASAN